VRRSWVPSAFRCPGVSFIPNAAKRRPPASARQRRRTRRGRESLRHFPRAPCVRLRAGFVLSDRLRASCVKRATRVMKNAWQRRIFSRVSPGEFEGFRRIPRASVRQTRNTSGHTEGCSLTSEWAGGSTPLAAGRREDLSGNVPQCPVSAERLSGMCWPGRDLGGRGALGSDIRKRTQ